MILVSQDGFKAFNMAHIRSYFIYKKNTKSGYSDFPNKETDKETDDENAEYIIWADSSRYDEAFGMYSVGSFKNLEDAKKVFKKLALTTNPNADGVIIINGNDVIFLDKDSARIHQCGETT